MKASTSSLLLTGMALVTLAAVGCKKKSSDIHVRQNYEVTFDEYERTSAKASFTAGADNKPVVFSNISQVLANGIVRNGLAQMPQGGFSWVFNAASEVVFTFKKDDNSILTNRISKSIFENIKITGDSVFSVDDTIRLSWTGGVPEDYDYVAFSLTRLYDGSGLESSSAVEVVSGQEFVFDYAETSNFHPGAYQLKMYITKTLPLQQADGAAGGQMSVARQLTRFVSIQ